MFIIMFIIFLRKLLNTCLFSFVVKNPNLNFVVFHILYVIFLHIIERAHIFLCQGIKKNNCISETVLIIPFYDLL